MVLPTSATVSPSILFHPTSFPTRGQTSLGAPLPTPHDAKHLQERWRRWRISLDERRRIWLDHWRRWEARLHQHQSSVAAARTATAPATLYAPHPPTPHAALRCPCGRANLPQPPSCRRWRLRPPHPPRTGAARVASPHLPDLPPLHCHRGRRFPGTGTLHASRATHRGAAGTGSAGPGGEPERWGRLE
jgi:hypothetical protein